MKPNVKLDWKMWDLGYVSVQEASERTSLPSSSLYDKMDQGVIGETRVGPRRYIEIESLLEWGGDAIRSFWNASLK